MRSSVSRSLPRFLSKIGQNTLPYLSLSCRTSVLEMQPVSHGAGHKRFLSRTHSVSMETCQSCPRRKNEITQAARYLLLFWLYLWRTMVHDDLRVEWIRQRVCAGFHLQQSPCFDELLCRDDGRDEELIIGFLNVVSQEDRPLCLLFFKTVTEEDVEVKISVSKSESLFCEHSNGTVWKVIPATVTE